MEHSVPRAIMRMYSLVGCLCTFAAVHFFPISADAAEELISSSLNGKTQKKESGEPSLSGDGKLVVFSSLNQLLPADQNSLSDVYLENRDTGELRLVSDGRGGDQPLISENGRFVVYRSLEELPKIRLVDLESTEAPRTISYPFGAGRSFRGADSADVSPNGQFVSFSFRPSPLATQNDQQLCVNTTTEPDRKQLGSTEITNGLALKTLGRGVMDRDGNRFFLETSDSLDPADQNGEQDIYKLERGGISRVLLSTTAAGLPQTGAARDPVVTANGRTVFFISERQLTPADTDGRATIYRSNEANGFAVPTPIPTEVRPLRLSRQATSTGEYLVFLGQAGKGAPRPYLLRVSDGALFPLARSATEAPVISADEGSIAVTTGARLAKNDSNRAQDVFVIANPVEGARLPPVTVTFNAPPDQSTFAQGQSFSLSATASAGAVGVLYTALEVDGVEFLRRSGAVVQFPSYSPPPGVYAFRAVAYSQANVAAYSDEVTITVRPGGNQLRITDIVEIQQKADADGAVQFNGRVRLDNTFASARGPLQLVITEAATPADWDGFGDRFQVPLLPEQVLQVIDVPSLGRGGSEILSFGSITSAPETTSAEGFEGRGWTVQARLRELVDSSWVTRDTFEILQVLPRLNEDTPGPNGGIPVPGAPQGDPDFNPALLQSVQISGRTTVGEKTSTTYRATAVFNTGAKPCTPQWELVDAAGVASISTGGVLTTSAVPKPKKIGVKATFGGRTQTLSVTIQPNTPVVSVSASPKVAPENGEGAFRILRSKVTAEPLEVSYEISGTALPDVDYTALSGTATIPAGASSVNVRVASLDDGNFEGIETVQLRLLGSSSYRVGSSRTAVVTIEDDEPVPAGQPDLVLQFKKQTVGEQVFGFDTMQQQLVAAGKKGKPTSFTAAVVNRTALAQTLTVRGGGDFLGFSVRYFDGGDDITEDVLAGTYQIANLAAGAAASIQVEITPTAAAPLGTSITVPIRVSSGGRTDAAELVLTRAR